MKKANKSGSSRMPAKKASAAKKSVQPRASQPVEVQLLPILDRLAQSTEMLVEAAERLNEAAAVLQASVTAAGGQAPERQDEMSETPGEVVGVMVIDEGEEE